MKQEFPQNTELTYGIVGDLGGSGALLPENAYAYMRFQNHVSVVSPITDGQSNLIESLDQLDYLGLLCGSHSAKNQRIDSGDYVQQVVLALSKR